MANIAKNTETKQDFKFLEALKAKTGDWYIIETRGQNGCSVMDRDVALAGVGVIFFNALLFYKSFYDYDYTRFIPFMIRLTLLGSAVARSG